jgi:hypothetical protein
MKSNSPPMGTLPETGYVRQFQLIPFIFPFSSATLWRKVKAADRALPPGVWRISAGRSSARSNPNGRPDRTFNCEGSRWSQGK